MTQLWMHRLFPPWPTVNRLLQPRQCCFIQQQGLLPRRGIPSSIPSSVWRGRGVVEAWRKRHGSSYLHRRDPGPLVLLVAGGGGDKIPRRLPLLLSTAEDVCLLDDLQDADC